MRYRTILIIALLTVSCSVASAAPRKPTSIGTEYPVIMRGVRPLGMGNAFLTMPGDDTIAQFYNPAAINDFDAKREYQVLAPMADFTPSFFGLTSDLLDLKGQLHGATSSKQKIEYFDRFVSRNTGDFEEFTTSMALFHVRHELGVCEDRFLFRVVRSVRFHGIEKGDGKRLIYLSYTLRRRFASAL